MLAHGTARASAAAVGPMILEQPDHGAARFSIGKIAISIISAFAFVYFRFPLRKTFFWMIFVTLMLPVDHGTNHCLPDALARLIRHP